VSLALGARGSFARRRFERLQQVIGNSRDRLLYGSARLGSEIATNLVERSRSPSVEIMVVSELQQLTVTL
jgi:hypothetical protein